MAPQYPDATAIVEAIRLIVTDFDDRPTHPVVGAGGRTYAFYPTAITDNIPALAPALSDAVCLLASLHIDPSQCPTLGVGEEDRGAMIIADILRQYGLPRTLARWTPSGAPGEIEVPMANEYLAEGNARIYLNGVRTGDRILLVDDLISTGGTLCAMAQAIELAGAQIVDIFTIGEKTENGGRQALLQASGVRVKTLLATDMRHVSGHLRSRVRHVNLGHLDTERFAAVASHFPTGFCRPGFGYEEEPQTHARFA